MVFVDHSGNVKLRNQRGHEYSNPNLAVRRRSMSFLRRDVCVVMSDSSSRSVSPQGESSDYDDLIRQPIQLFGLKCEKWDDVYAVLKDHSDHPELLDKFLILYCTHIK